MTPTTDAIESVLLPTDDSDGAFAGARRGVDLAAAADTTVHVLSAIGFVSSMVRDRRPDLEVTTATERGTPFRVIDRTVSARRPMDR